jgi:hypothetical protein
MLLRLTPKKTNASIIAATSLHSAALVALWMSAAPQLILIALSLAIGFSVVIVLRALNASAAITSLHFQTWSTQLCLSNKEWLEVGVTVRRCDRLVVVLGLECLDSDSVYFKQCWYLWIIPGVISATQQRRLRRFIRWQMP